MLGWGRDCLSCLLLLVDGRPAAEVPSLSVCPSGWHWPYATKKARRTSEEDEAGNKSKARINRIHPNRLSYAVPQQTSPGVLLKKKKKKAPKTAQASPVALTHPADGQSETQSSFFLTPSSLSRTNWNS
ncbi:hypothetical protein AWENTII_000966 [Aspergillus wentii]